MLSQQCSGVVLKVGAMHPEVAGDQNYDDDYANYSEDVHSVVLQLLDNSVRL